MAFYIALAASPQEMIDRVDWRSLKSAIGCDYVCHAARHGDIMGRVFEPAHVDRIGECGLYGAVAARHHDGVGFRAIQFSQGAVQPIYAVKDARPDVWELPGDMQQISKDRLNPAAASIDYQPDCGHRSSFLEVYIRRPARAGAIQPGPVKNLIPKPNKFVMHAGKIRLQEANSCS